jgi:hypothetical protein
MINISIDDLIQLMDYVIETEEAAEGEIPSKEKKNIKKTGNFQSLQLGSEVKSDSTQNGGRFPQDALLLS